MAKVTIKGGPELKVRLDSIPGVAGPEIMATWANDAARNIRAAAPRGRGSHGQHLADSIVSGTKGAATRRRGRGAMAGVRAAVFGAYWGIFVDRGTKAHDIKPKRSKSTTGKGAPALQFITSRGGDSIFRPKARVRRIGRRPFITEGAQKALRDLPWADKVLMAWSRKAETRGFGRLRG